MRRYITAIRAASTVQRETFEGENFRKFRGFVEVFSAKFGAWQSLAPNKQAIRESFLHENRIFHQSAKVFKFSPSKVSHYTV